MPQDKNIIIIGAGPSGIACANTLAQGGKRSIVLEKDNIVGGLCRTIAFNGYFFDIGGHRFLSDNDRVNRLWQSIMGDDMLRVKRLSRIYYRKKFFNYPLTFANTFLNLGPAESLNCLASYLIDVSLKPGDDKTFEGWIINRFGRRLYNIFFKTYTNKILGLDCNDISSDWAQQRIGGLSLRSAVKNAIFGKGNDNPKTLYGEFLYPKNGPGDMYERLKRSAESAGASFLCNKTVIAIRHDGGKIVAVETKDSRGGRVEQHPCDHLFSSAPLPLFVSMLKPAAPKQIIDAAQRLRFRSMVIVNIIIDKEFSFPDQWIYIHSSGAKLCRIQNYKNWSPGMVVDPKKTSLGLEYFCTENDSLWQASDKDLLDLAVEELEKIGLSEPKNLLGGFVVRQPDAYPVYKLGYKDNVKKIIDYLDGLSNLQCIGRAGLFRYDNSDLALLSGMGAADSFLEIG